ncbi:uncharacterized protein LOC6612755 [Drosophila sechellia]|nr:uncharacterized protein LOC6612755 [Drosophila sechellia]
MMASYEAVSTAALIHLVFRISISPWPPRDICSPAPNVGAWIFTFALLLLATDVKMYPNGYPHLPYIIQFLVETVGSLFIVELSTSVVWCGLESMTHQLTRLLLLFWGMDGDTYQALEYWILLVPTTAVASIFLYIMMRAIISEDLIYGKPQVTVHLNKEVLRHMVSKRRQKRRKNI